MPTSSGGNYPDQVDDPSDVREINEALIAMSVRQHELIEDAEQAHRELLESETFNRSVFEGSPDCVKVLDGDGRLVRINHNGLCVMEIDDFVPLNGRPWCDLWPAEKQPDVRATLDAARAGREARFQGHCPTFKGNDKWWDVNVSAVRDADGNVARFIAVSRDITDRVKVEQALREANRRKSEFLAMLAHELRNPLAPLRNAARLLRLTGGDAEATGPLCEMMERQVSQMVRLVDDLLDVSRVDQGKIELRRSRVEFASVVKQALEAARPLVEAAGHELVVTLPSQPVYLDGDSTRLAQVMGNLLTNACKFTEKGGCISLTVELAHRAAGIEDEAIIRVRDSGIGIAADQLPHIFDMFMQVDTSLGRSVSGLGIGLTLVKNLVEMHGGTVEVRSGGLGRGSEFAVRLPVLIEKPKPLSVPSVTETQDTKARRILVVDDNRDSARSLAMLLKLEGNATHTAHDGLEAVEAAAAFKPDVVLLDIGLPGLDGYEACRRIREQPGAKSMMLVALTGWGQEEDRQKSKDAGFNSHLVKPVDFGALTKLLAGFSDK